MLILIAVIAAWGWKPLLNHANRRPDGTISGLDRFYLPQTGNPSLCEYATPDGIRYTVDTTAAAYRLSMRPEDAHSRRVFPTYGAAIRYAREHGLPGIPSTPMILTTCAAADTRLQTALELALDTHPRTGRRALVQQWFEAVAKLRTATNKTASPACDAALSYLATAIRLQGEQPSPQLDLTFTEPAPTDDDPPLGPWATSPALATIWHRDRHLATGLKITDDIQASAAAILALTLPGGWSRQAAVARVLHGNPQEPTFESLAAKLATFANHPTDPAAAILVRQEFVDPEHRPAPAALAFATSPEQEILEPLQMRAWGDPVAAMIQAIRNGSLSLEPGPDAGFYRHRWFALETLASPIRAPEHHKLQLSPDYERRWQRAFAAGFTEGRSGFVKRLPTSVACASEDGPVPLEIAPRFTAEPSPVVYLRLSRAYRMLAEGLDRARENEFPGLAETTGNLRLKAAQLLGLAAMVYREVGHPIPIEGAESAVDLKAAESAATAWIETIANDPGITGDARTVVPLAGNGMGQLRCPAVLGVRLEPVEYGWVEEPNVSSNIDPVFVSARLWLPSPVTATLTTSVAPVLSDFRARCDTHADVASVCRAFGQEPPRLVASRPRRWPWMVGGLVVLASCWIACRWWWRKRWRTRLLTAAAAMGVVAGLAAAIVFHPPVWLARRVFIANKGLPQALTHASFGLLMDWSDGWPEPLRRAVFFSLIRDPEDQVRYAGALLGLASEKAKSPWNPGGDELQALRELADDPVPEVQFVAWRQLAKLEVEIPLLLKKLETTTTGPTAWDRIHCLADRQSTPEMMDALEKLARHRDLQVRQTTFMVLLNWKTDAPRPLVTLRKGTHDPDPMVRRIATRALGTRGTVDDLPRLFELLNDPVKGPRVAAFYAILKQGGWSAKNPPKAPIPLIESEVFQSALTGYASSPVAEFDERFNASRWIVEPEDLREISRKLLRESATLAEEKFSSLRLHKSRRDVEETLVNRWLQADGYARGTIGSELERSSICRIHSPLLAKLVRSILDNPDPSATWTLLREYATTQSTERKNALNLLDWIENGPGR
jgi:hypothetical protein